MKDIYSPKISKAELRLILNAVKITKEHYSLI